MKQIARIALIGDYTPAVTAHQAIPPALDLAAHQLGLTVQYHWIDSERLSPASQLDAFDAVWCVPASPYRHDDNILQAIRFARETHIPFLGTCGVVSMRCSNTLAMYWAGMTPIMRKSPRKVVR
ncbi:CTP synthase [Dickeya solani]|nr:CTP synthase [Dickeya solani]